MVDLKPRDVLVGDVIKKMNNRGDLEYLLINVQRWDGYDFYFFEICPGGFCNEWWPDWMVDLGYHARPLPMRWNVKYPGNTRKPVWSIRGETEMKRKNGILCDEKCTRSPHIASLCNGGYIGGYIVGYNQSDWVDSDYANNGWSSASGKRRGDNDDFHDRK